MTDSVIQFKVIFQNDCRRLAIPQQSLNLVYLKGELLKLYFNNSIDSETIVLKYLDEDKDLVTIAREEELSMAVDQFKNKTIRLEVFLKQDISAFSSPMPSYLNSTLTGSMTPTAVLAAPSSSNNNSALITAAASSFVNSPSFSASPRTSLQTHSNKKVTFRPGPNSTISNLEASAAVAAAAAAANATSTLNSPQRTFRAPSTYHHRHQDSPSTLPSTPTANNAAILPETPLTPESIARNKQLLGEDYGEGDIVQMLRDISFFISTIVEEELVSHISQKSLITSRALSGDFGVNSPSRSSKDQQVLNLSNIREWTVENVGQWMSANGFGEHIALFKENDIDGEALLALDHETLRSMSISSAGKRLKILRTIAALSLFASQDQTVNNQPSNDTNNNSNNSNNNLSNELEG